MRAATNAFIVIPFHLGQTKYTSYKESPGFISLVTNETYQ
jgi:hypothetical protein